MESSFFSPTVKSVLVSLPASRSLTYWWNLGSFLGITLVIQLVSGLFLLLNYSPGAPYESVLYIIIEVNFGWLFKLFHSNNASVIFAILYLHLVNNLSVGSYRLHNTWNTGLVIMLLLIGAGFSGYVLVGSQISFWAAMVITAFISVIPLYGETLIYLVWGGFSIGGSTIQLLFVVHFILPFLVMGVMILHLLYLHNSGSTSLIFSHCGVENVPFYPLYWVNDVINISVYWGLIIIILVYPYSLGEAELWQEVNPLVSPLHIVPEWYFLTAYATLRSVPNKALGVILIIINIVVYFVYPYVGNLITPPEVLVINNSWVYVCLFVLATYLGACPLEIPYLYVGLLVTVFTFFSHILFIFIWSIEEWVYVV